MPTNPKLEFYRFKLNPKNESEKTFRLFAIDELKANKSITNEKVIEILFKHFIKSLGQNFAKDDKLKKQLAVIKKKNVNKHLDKQPTFSSGSDTIYGVVNGGPFGRDRIASNINDEEDSTVLGSDKSVLSYFYFFLYLPADHNEGCFIIHSNSSEDTITILFRNFISHLFKGANYNKAILEAYCPKSFQSEFLKGAILKSMTFKTSFVDNIQATDGISEKFKSYDITIEVTPKDKDISVTVADKFKLFLSKKLFGTSNQGKKLNDFEETKFNVANDVTKGTKVFEWNNKDREFVPVVYLANRIEKMNSDGTPDFVELGELCLKLFNDDILTEIRPDLNAIKR